FTDHFLSLPQYHLFWVTTSHQPIYLRFATFFGDTPRTNWASARSTTFEKGRVGAFMLGHRTPAGKCDSTDL
ncbi:MAG TPA: hypothetical protein PK299_09975, partial [Anaerolineales bacterium]|nr:hypothetical protein [Anaerolineales bacterium]